MRPRAQKFFYRPTVVLDTAVDAAVVSQLFFSRLRARCRACLVVAGLLATTRASAIALETTSSLQPKLPQRADCQDHDGHHATSPRLQSKQSDSSDVTSDACRLRIQGRLALSKGYSGVHDQPQKPTLGCTALDKTRLHNCSQTAAVQVV